MRKRNTPDVYWMKSAIGQSRAMSRKERLTFLFRLSRNHRLSGLRFDDLQTELDGSFLE